MKSYITDEESKKCGIVKEAFAELYDFDEACVLDTGNYGYIMLRYYNENRHGFEFYDCFADALSLFDALWQEWMFAKLFEYGECTVELSKNGFKGVYDILPDEKRDELLSNKERFAKMAGITGYRRPDDIFY